MALNACNAPVLAGTMSECGRKSVHKCCLLYDQAQRQHLPYMTMRIFFPECAVRAKSGLCIGQVDHSAHTICVLALINGPLKLHEIIRQLQTTSIGGKPLTILGPLTDAHDPDHMAIQLACEEISRSLCIEFTKQNAHSLPTCTLLRDGKHTEQDYCLILYNQSQIPTHSLPNLSKTTHNTDDSSNQVSTSTNAEDSHSNQDKRTFEEIQIAFAVIQEGICEIGALTDLAITVDGLMFKDELSLAQQVCSSFLLAMVSILNFTLLPFRSNLCSRVSQKPWFYRVLTFTQTGCQIQAKYNHVQSLVSSGLGASDDVDGCKDKERRKTKFKSRDDYLRLGNLCAYLVIDTLLGVLLMWWIQHNNWPDLWAQWIIASANTTAESLQTLLNWLMGAPAGLKLNSALAHFLGQFFLYHVYLWVAYLSLIRPVLGWVIWSMSLTGCLGVSVILAVGSDMLSMLTLHIYCFYVYAARMYNLQFTGLLALSRLFRGKKWNVLRKRVDTCHYDVDQLFIGALLFTILLFLLPTTLMFYGVFTLLRLAILVLKGILMKTIQLLQRLPMFSLLLCLCGSKELARSLCFTPIQQLGEGCSSAVVMEIKYLSVIETLQLSYEPNGNESASDDVPGMRNLIFSLGADLITGRLIYPWGQAQPTSS